MSRPFRLFVSSSPDLAPEREALGQAVAELPVAIGWELKHTPMPGEEQSDTLGFIERCDLCIVLLGADFAAPMGLELQMAMEAGRGTLAYRKNVLRSPSAQEAMRHRGIMWGTYGAAHEIKAQVKQLLAQRLLDEGEIFGLHLDDVEGLLALAGEAAGDAPAGPDERQGADRGGVILGRGG